MDPLPLNQVLCGDCAELLQGFPSDSVDLVVTDPPYGLSFMGKDWDKALPSKEAFTQINRVLKPGALCFVMSSPRQDLMARMILLLEDAGFRTDLSFIDWVYKTGFPKAYDVSKGIDQKLGLKRKTIGIKEANYNADIAITRKEQGYRPNIADTDRFYQITAPASDEAKQWDGWKSQTGLKPAQEPVLMVYKPRSEPTIVDNVLKWGTGAINVDACRIPTNNLVDQIQDRPVNRSKRDSCEWGLNKDTIQVGQMVDVDKGRFPANLVVSDGALNTGEISKSGTLEAHHKINSLRTREIYGEYNNQPPEEHTTYGDIGDQSRYFDLDAWAEHHGILDIPKPDSAERDYGLKGAKQDPKSKFNLNDGQLERFDGAKVTPRRNTHPTVKPIKLMAYLIELGCPPDGIVMDPFLGSGTTCIAAKQLRRKYIGIEISPDYHALSEARIAAYPQPLEWFNTHADNPAV